MTTGPTRAVALDETLAAPRLLGAAQVALAACGWGAWSLFLRPVALPPLACSALVFSVMALGTVPFFGREPAPRWDRETIRWLAAFAVLDAVNASTFFSAMRQTSVAVAVLTHSFAPLLVALLAPYVDGQRVHGARRAAAVALSGIVLLLRPWEPQGDSGPDTLLGAALGTASAFAYAGNIFLAKRLTPRIGAFRTMGLHALGSALLLAPLALPGLAVPEASDLARVAVGGVMLGVVANVAFARGLTVIGSARTAVLALLEPLVGCLVGWLVWGEPLGPTAALGAAAILGAGALVTRASGAATPS